MTNDKIKGTAYYLGALSTFATFIGIEAYNYASYGNRGLEGKVEAFVFGIPMVVLLPMGIYCVGKSVKYFIDDKRDKK